MAADTRQPPHLDDDGVTAALLSYLLELAPRAISIVELRREFLGLDPSFAETDQFVRAVRDLQRYGLIASTSLVVMPTRAAEHFHRLMRFQ